MSIQAITWALEKAPGVPPRLVSTLMGLANHADNDGRGAYPARRTLARYTRKSERAVTRDLAELASLGLIRDGDQRFVLHIPANRRPHVWDLALERVAEQEETPKKVNDPRHQTSAERTTGASTDESLGASSDRGRNCGTSPERGKTECAVLGGSRRPPNHPKNLGDSLRSSPVVSAIASRPTDAPPPRHDVERICEHLADRIEGNGATRPTITRRWRNAARLMLDRDRRTEQQIHTAIDWCQDDDFWRGNILSLPKLREKYDQLRLHALRSTHTPSARRHTPFTNPDDPSRYATEAF